jgi:hypothetical protein
VAVVAVAVAGAGGAFAASRLDSPNARSQAIIDDAASQLNIAPSKLSAALQKAIDNQIDAAVKAGTLTKEQGDAMKQRVDAGQVPLVGGLGGLGGFGPGRLGHHFGFGAGPFGAASKAVASYLGITTDELRTELRSGKTLAQIAVAHTKTADGLVAAMLADAKKKLDQAVIDKKLTASAEQTLLDHLKTLLTAVVNGQRPRFSGSPAPLQGFGFARPGGLHGFFRFHALRPTAATPTA